MTGKGSGRRGRPLGFRLSDFSKRSISLSKTGQQHKQETKDKISRSLLLYFKRKNPISEELTNRYFRIAGDSIIDWLQDAGEELDSSLDIMTDKALFNKGKIEISCGNNIEYFSHGITPELIILFREYCTINNLNPEDVLMDIL